MIRDSLTGNASSKVVNLRLSSSAGEQLLWPSPPPGGTLMSLSGPSVQTPYWVQLTRQGNTFLAFVSPDGATWTQVGSAIAITMPTSVLIGLTAAANSFGNMARAVFDNVTVTSTPNFDLTVSPTSQTVVPSATATYAVSVGALSGFSGAVSLTVTGLPTGATATFTPSSITGSGTSTLAIATTANTAFGSYPLTVTGTSGALTHSTPIALVAGAPHFTISVSPTSARVLVTSSVSYTITIGAINGFTGVVNLSATGLPSGSSVSFTPSSITGSGTATATITTSANTPGRAYQLVFIGTSGSLTHSANASLTVTATDFSLSLHTAWMTLPAGCGSATPTLTAT